MWRERARRVSVWIGSEFGRRVLSRRAISREQILPIHGTSGYVRRVRRVGDLMGQNADVGLFCFLSGAPSRNLIGNGAMPPVELGSVMTGKADLPTNAAQVVRTTLLVPDDFSARAKPLNDLAATLPTDLRIISTSFSENLSSVIQTLSIPFTYTHAHVHSLHWQRIHIAERIRARRIENEAEREPAALNRANEVMASYLNGEGRDKLVDDVLDRLLAFKDIASLAAARELTRKAFFSLGPRLRC